jgi:hypothetical protein
MAEALVLSGAGRYADPWHPFGRTSLRLASLATEAGYGVSITEEIDQALSVMTSLDLLIVNAGDPWRLVAGGRRREHLDRDQLAAGEERLRTAIESGLAVLAVHQAVSSLRDYPSFRSLIGCAWEPGVTWHPPLGEAEVRLVPGHPAVRGLADFRLDDERYVDLYYREPPEPFAWHEEAGRRHPLAWSHEVGDARVVIDLLGHDERSYDAPEHCQLLVQAMRWQCGGPAPTDPVVSA